MTKPQNEKNTKRERGKPLAENIQHSNIVNSIVQIYMVFVRGFIQVLTHMRVTTCNAAPLKT